MSKKNVKRRLAEVGSFAATAQAEAEKINAQTNAGYVTDQSFWEKQGIFTGEELAVSVVNQTYSDLYKELHGIRPRHKSFETVTDAQKAIKALDDAYSVMIEMERMDAEVQAAYEAERAELEELMPGSFDFEQYPMQTGMRRRNEGVRKIKITRTILSRIIKEATLNEFFGGKEKKEKRAKATQELQKAAMDYINDFSSSKVGPFLKKGDDVRGPYNVKGRLDPEGEYYSQVIRQDLTDNDLAHGQRLDDEQHEEMKKHHEVLEGIKDAWESATGKRADNDDAPFDVRYVSKALAIPSLYLRGNPDSANEGKKTKVTKRLLKRIIREEAAKMTPKYDDDSSLKGDQSELPDHLQKGIIDKAKKSKKEAHHEMEESDAPHLAQYRAPQGSKRDKQLDATKADLASGDPERKAAAWRRRQRMEDKAAEKNESRLREAIRSIMAEALSKATEDKIRKKAKERGMTFGSMKAEYKKGLAAWGSSGSRPGVSQHAWAMARINKANPSDDWSVVKKSKAKK